MNRVHRYLRVGSEALAAMLEDDWRFSFAVSGLSRQGLTDEKIAEQFPPCSHDKVLNARRAYGLFAELRKLSREHRNATRRMRHTLSKSNFEIAARYYYSGKCSLSDAFDGLYHNPEHSARELDRTMAEKHGENLLKRDLAIVARVSENAVTDLFSWADGRGPEAMRLARALREAYVPFAEQVELVRDRLREERK